MNPFPKAPAEQAGGQLQQEQLMELLKTNPELMQKYQEEMAKLQAQSAKSHPPMTSKEYLEKLPSIQKYLDSDGGITIKPTQAFVLKFLEKRSNEKIFINIVTHEVIDHPQQKLLIDYENQPGLRIPMSMGRVKEDHDKNGNACKVVDVVLNPKIVATAEVNPDILGFTSQIIGNYLLQKYKIAVDEEKIKKVKGVKYKGSKVEVQRVKGKKAPKIEQISEEDLEIKRHQEAKEEQLFNEMNNATKQAMKPDFEVEAYTEDNKFQPYSLDVTSWIFLKITFDLPHLIHSKGIHLQGSNRQIYLSVKGLYEICLNIPCNVREWKCQFSRKQRKLQVRAYPLLAQQSTLPNSNDKKGLQNKIKLQIENDLLYDIV